MLDKESNSILFAVVGFGGFLGIAEKYHPMPWSALDYDPKAGSYVVDYTKEQLKAAPAGSIDELTRDDGLAYRDRVFDYYKITLRRRATAKTAAQPSSCWRPGQQDARAD